MRVSRFERREGLIIVEARVWGPLGARDLDLVLDSGSTDTLIVPEVLDGLGYSARQGEGITVIRSAVAEERGYLIRTTRFRALGHEASNFRIHAHDLPDDFGIHGLIGLNFLDQLDYTVRSAAQRIEAERLPRP